MWPDSKGPMLIQSSKTAYNGGHGSCWLIFGATSTPGLTVSFPSSQCFFEQVVPSLNELNRQRAFGKGMRVSREYCACVFWSGRVARLTLLRHQSVEFCPVSVAWCRFRSGSPSARHSSPLFFGRKVLSTLSELSPWSLL